METEPGDWIFHIQRTLFLQKSEEISEILSVLAGLQRPDDHWWVTAQSRKKLLVFTLGESPGSGVSFKLRCASGSRKYHQISDAMSNYTTTLFSRFWKNPDSGMRFEFGRRSRWFPPVHEGMQSSADEISNLPSTFSSKLCVPSNYSINHMGFEKK